MILYNKSEEYSYRKAYQYTQYILVMVLTLGIIGMWIMILILGKGLSKEILTEAKAAAAIFTGILSLCIALSIYRAAIYKNAKLSLLEGVISYKHGRRKMIIVIKDITEVKIKTFSLFGGSIYIKSGGIGTIFKLNMQISNVSDFLNKFWCELKLNRNENLEISGDFLKLTNAACFADQSWNRLNDILSKLIILIILSSMAGAFLVFLKQASLKNSIYTMITSTAAPFIGYVIAELIITWNFAVRLKNDSVDRSGRDKTNDYKIFKIILAVYIIAFTVTFTVMLIV